MTPNLGSSPSNQTKKQRTNLSLSLPLRASCLCKKSRLRFFMWFIFWIWYCLRFYQFFEDARFFSLGAAYKNTDCAWTSFLQDIFIPALRTFERECEARCLRHREPTSDNARLVCATASKVHKVTADEEVDDEEEDDDDEWEICRL